jgi:Putative quorum-sensing-regulated virulence factor
VSGFAADLRVQLQLRPIEAKLLALALDPAARGNEVATSAEKLINGLRARGVSTAEVFRSAKPSFPAASSAAWSATDTTLTRALAMRMPFGKYRYKQLREVPLNYLTWAKRNCCNMSADLRGAIAVILRGTL